MRRRRYNQPHNNTIKMDLGTSLRHTLNLSTENKLLKSERDTNIRIKIQYIRATIVFVEWRRRCAVERTGMDAAAVCVRARSSKYHLNEKGRKKPTNKKYKENVKSLWRCEEHGTMLHAIR